MESVIFVENESVIFIERIKSKDVVIRKVVKINL